MRRVRERIRIEAMLLHFDYDGVLVDSFDELLSAAQKAASETGLGRPPTRSDFETIEDLTAAGIASLLGVPQRGVDLYTRRMHRALDADGREPAMFPGVPDMLRTLSKQHTLVIVTSNFDHLVRRGLSLHGVEDCVALVLDAQRPGTKGEKIAHALERFGAPRRESFMVGDTRGDIRHGKTAGVRTAGVTWGYQDRRTLEREAPDFIVDSPRELLDLLRAAAGRGDA